MNECATSGVRSRMLVPFCSVASPIANSRESSGPRSASQNRTIPDSCRTALTPSLARASRSRASASWVLSAPAPPGTAPTGRSAPASPAGPVVSSVVIASRTGEATTMPPVPVVAAPASTAVMPPGSAAISRASPPSGGSSHSPALGGTFPARPARVGAAGDEQQRPVGQEARAALPFRRPGEPSRGTARAARHRWRRFARCWRRTSYGRRRAPGRSRPARCRPARGAGPSCAGGRRSR